MKTLSPLLSSEGLVSMMSSTVINPAFCSLNLWLSGRGKLLSSLCILNECLSHPEANQVQYMDGHGPKYIYLKINTES